MCTNAYTINKVFTSLLMHLKMFLFFEKVSISNNMHRNCTQTSHSKCKHSTYEWARYNASFEGYNANSTKGWHAKNDCIYTKKYINAVTILRVVFSLLLRPKGIKVFCGSYVILFKCAYIYKRNTRTCIHTFYIHI